MQPLGFLSVVLGVWCVYCAAHSYNPVSMLSAVISHPSDARDTLTAASSAVKSSEAGNLPGAGASAQELKQYMESHGLTDSKDVQKFLDSNRASDLKPGETFMGPFTGDPISDTFAQHVARHSGAPGVDFAIPAGTPIQAPFTGVLSYHPLADPLSGNVLQETLSNGDVLSLRHVEGVVPNLVGKTVQAGTVIGYSGGVAGASGSGDSTGPHVHVDLRTTSGKYIPFYDLYPKGTAV